VSATATRRYFAPEVVQTSAMDCGPASLKCVLDGHGIGVSYARLRDACQTDVDGTSIDTMETVANQLGLSAEQIVIPPDHLVLREAAALPAIVVVRLSDRLTHFVVLWRRHGPYLQVMDPSGGRRWMRSAQFLRELYIHRMDADAAEWRTWAATDEFTGPLGQRLRAIGVGRTEAVQAIQRAVADSTWRELAALDAATRMTQALIDAGGLSAGRDAAATIASITERIRHSPDSWRTVPERFWSVFPAGAADGAEPGAGTPESIRLTMTGAVLVRFHAQRDAPVKNDESSARLAGETISALPEAPVRPAREILAMLRADRALSIPLLLLATIVASAAVAFEALLFRALLDVGRDLGVREQRVVAVAAILTFTLLLSVVDYPLSSWLLAAGRRLEAGLRLRFFARMPQLGDRYFRSRLTSDIAERVHSLHVMRQLPPLAGRAVRTLGELAATAIGIVWIDPASTIPALLLVAAIVLMPLAAYPTLAELELRMRTHAGALSRYYLDALIGLVPIRVHGAERPVRQEHGRVLGEWITSGRQLLAAAVGVDTLQTALGFGLAAWLLWSHLARGGDSTSLLLLYWALRLPVLGDDLAAIVRQYPTTRNVMLRLLEPLLAPVEEAPAAAPVAGAESRGGVAIEMQDVAVRAAGRTLLCDVRLSIRSGEQLAIVGASGAGKSTLVGLLLGWHRPAVGSLLVDGRPLDDAGLASLRAATAWVDPAIQIWNRPMLDNLQYGNPHDARHAAGFAVTAANLQGLIERLPHGLQTALGEGGALVSGGEGQRIRLGRALLRRNVRLVVLDEPFRGLDREARESLMASVRRHWREATLVCITHDVAETQSFDRVLVVDSGVVVEDDDPRRLLARASRYRDLSTAERDVRDRLWASRLWRRLRMDDGKLVEERREEPA
jgi:ATP-binding cassette subfamily B protein